MAMVDPTVSIGSAGGCACGNHLRIHVFPTGEIIGDAGGSDGAIGGGGGCAYGTHLRTHRITKGKNILRELIVVRFLVVYFINLLGIKSCIHKLQPTAAALLREAFFFFWFPSTHHS